MRFSGTSAALGDETFTVAAVEELRRSGDLLYMLHGKQHHPLAYLVMEAFVPPAALVPPPVVGAPAAEIPASNPILRRCRLVAFAEWLLSIPVLFLIARQVLPRPWVAVAIFLALPTLSAFEARPYALHLLLGLLMVYTGAAVLYARRALVWLAVPAFVACTTMALYTFIFSYLYLPVFGLAAIAELRKSRGRALLLGGAVLVAFAATIPYLRLFFANRLPGELEPHPFLEQGNVVEALVAFVVAVGVLAAGRAVGWRRETAARVAFVALGTLLALHAVVYWGFPIAAVGAAAYLGATSGIWWLIHGAIVIPYVLNPEGSFDNHVMASAALVSVPLAFVIQHPKAGRLGTAAAVAIAALFVMSLLDGVG